MNINRVIVFGATGFQGRPQVRELVRKGYAVKAVSRSPDSFAAPEFVSVEGVSADYGNLASLRRALTDVDAILFQAPALGNVQRLLGHIENLIAAAKYTGVNLVVVNSSMWAPDGKPCGDIVYDGVAAMERLFIQSGLPWIIFRPTLFMNNLQGDWIRSQIVNGAYPYCHKPGMKADWICLEDVAKFMVAALQRPDLVGRKIRLGGPERLTTLEMLEIISEAVGRTVTLQYLTPRQFAEGFWHAFGHTTGLDQQAFVDEVAGFYTFNNDAPQRPFEADVRATLDIIPMELTDMRSWAHAQNWK